MMCNSRDTSTAIASSVIVAKDASRYFVENAILHRVIRRFTQGTTNPDGAFGTHVLDAYLCHQVSLSNPKSSAVVVARSCAKPDFLSERYDCGDRWRGSRTTSSAQPACRSSSVPPNTTRESVTRCSPRRADLRAQHPSRSNTAAWGDRIFFPRNDTARVDFAQMRISHTKKGAPHEAPLLGPTTPSDPEAPRGSDASGAARAAVGRPAVGGGAR